MAGQSGVFFAQTDSSDLAIRNTQNFKGLAHSICAPISKRKIVFTAAAFIGITLQRDDDVRICFHHISLPLNEITIFRFDREIAEIKIYALLLHLIKL